MKTIRKTIPLMVATATAASTVLGLLALHSPAAATEASRTGPACRGIGQVTVPGAEKLVSACLADLTTAGTTQTGHTNPEDGAGLSVAGTVNPTGVPGIQLDGYFPDTSTFNTNNGWNHDSQFVIRMPQDWNGGLVVAGPPGVRRQYANDFTISDWVLAKGYAYASTDKGNNGTTLYNDGDEPGDAIAEWHRRVTQLTVAAKKTLEQHYDRAPKRTYVAGSSAAGYLVRWQLENRAKHYDGGIDWNGLLVTPERSLLTYLPTALTQYPKYAADGSPQAHQAMLEAGFPRGSEPIWEFTYRNFWDPLQRTLREEVDPTYDGDVLGGHPFCVPGTAQCDADYDLATRPSEVRDAIADVSLTGRIKRPLITVQGTLDTAVTPRDSRLYASMIADQGRSSMARLYEIEGGSHFEALYGRYPGLLTPILPCFREAFADLEQWTKHDKAPARSHYVPRDPASDLLNTCAL